MRVLFVGRRDPVWYLGERVRMQTVGVFSVPHPPPATMLATRSIGEAWRVHSRAGVPATELVIAGANYHQFILSSLRLPEPGAEHPDPLLGGWVPPDARISYIGEGGSEVVEIIPEGRVFHAPLPEGVQAVPARTANAMVGVINRLKSALVRARSALSCRSPRSTQTETGRAGADVTGPSGFGGCGHEERERARHSPQRHRRSDVGASTSGERSGPERGRRSLSVAREPSPELQPQPLHWGGSGWGSSHYGGWTGWTDEAWRDEAEDES
ncbi:uncharacterized protein [Spinacia oleracea]|uniref:Uncharacterized protein n=1 Tax=Spinacia oleracea TaxID=3562 RepID=A0ABM3RQX8_SPIOL|nr:uncharacterized protein LOC130471755 [Spinacia oleracea]